MIFRTTDPLSTIFALQRAMDSAQSSDWFGSGISSKGAFPPINVFRQGDDFVIVAELPGVEKEKLDIQVKNSQVRIRGTKNLAYEDDLSVHRRERVSGEFDRTLSLPAEIEANAVKADYRDGVLAIYLPRAESDKPRAVSIE